MYFLFLKTMHVEHSASSILTRIIGVSLFYYVIMLLKTVQVAEDGPDAMRKDFLLVI